LRCDLPWNFQHMQIERQEIVSIVWSCARWTRFHRKIFSNR
jgi:hypothetical protein